MRPIHAVAATALAFAVAACAPVQGPAAAAARQCFFVSQVNGFQAESERTVIVEVGVNDLYELQMAGPCPNVDWSQRIGVAARGGGSSVCVGQDAELLVPQPGGDPWRCQVRTVRRLTEAEAEARG